MGAEALGSKGPNFASLSKKVLCCDDGASLLEHGFIAKLRWDLAQAAELGWLLLK